MLTVLSRRKLLKATVAMSVLPTLTAHAQVTTKKPKLRIAVKYGMIKIDGSIEDKLNLVKKLSFEGVEVDSPADSTRPTSRRRQIRPASRFTA